LKIGTFSLIPSPHVIEILGRFGFDFTVIDCEHGILNFETAENLVRAANASGITPYLRVPEKNNKKMINYGLEIGAQRIVIPDIRNAEELTQSIHWTTYGHNGRGACCFSRDSYERRPLSQSWAQFESQAPLNTGIIALLESQEAIKNLKSIVSVAGLKGVMVGPFDLSVSSGFHGDLTHPSFNGLLEQIVDESLKAGVTPYIPVFEATLEGSAELVEKWRKKGVNHFILSCDKGLLGENAKRYMNAFKK